MSQAGDFGVSFTARVVESFRGEWAPLDDVFSDPGVAMDFVRHITPSFGPTIVRARTSSGGLTDRLAIDGDWLCDDDDAYGSNTRLPRPNWDYERDRKGRWSQMSSLLDAWEECTDPLWLIYTAALAPVGPKVVVGAACACARKAAEALEVGGDQVLARLSVLESWVRDEADIAKVRRASAESMNVAVQMSDEAESSGTHEWAAAQANYAMADASFVAQGHAPTHTAVASVMSAAVSIDSTARASRRSSGRAPDADLAAVVRGAVPTITLLRAFLRREH